MNTLLSQINVDLLSSIAGPIPSSKSKKQLEIRSIAVSVLVPMMDAFGIDTPLRVAHFLAQLAHESDSFCTVEEYASGSAYEGRSDLGNVKKGDGIRYKGHGLIQCTGRRNHANFTAWLRSQIHDAPNFEVNPEQLMLFPWAAWVAIWYWDVKRLNVVADRDDLAQITRIINGGNNGLRDRSDKLNRAKATLARIVAGNLPQTSKTTPILYRGVQECDTDVERLQRLLHDARYYFGTIDGDFGTATENAVKALQHARRITVDGIAGEQTFAALTHLLGVDT